MGGGAWPFLVRGAICLVDSDNERDSYQVVVLGLLCSSFRSVVLVFQTCETIYHVDFGLHDKTRRKAKHPIPRLPPEQAANQAVREGAITGL